MSALSSIDQKEPRALDLLAVLCREQWMGHFTMVSMRLHGLFTLVEIDHACRWGRSGKYT